VASEPDAVRAVALSHKNVGQQGCRGSEEDPTVAYQTLVLSLRIVSIIQTLEKK
jgi:hypothetical protein